MSLSLYLMRIKCLMRNKQSIFWCYIFPLILSTCLYLGVSKLGVVEEFDTIKIAYISQRAESEEFLSVLKAAKFSENKAMFDISLCSREEAAELLDKGSIEAYIIGGSIPELYIRENGMNETIVKAFIDSYLQKRITIQNILKANPDAINEGLMDDLIAQKSFVRLTERHKEPDNLIIYFYAILAYTCMYAANWGLFEATVIQQDQSLMGARISASSINKMKLFICNMLAAYTCHIVSVILLFIYMKFVLNIKFGEDLFYLLAVCFIGSLTGLTFGATTGFWVKKKAEVKEAIMIAVTLICSFLSGMMSVDMKYYVSEKFPLLAYINPANLITDAMYSLYYFDGYKRYFIDLLFLIVIAAVFVAASYLGIRRKKYDSI